MADQELDRSEAATPFKLEEARKRGTAAKSPDVMSTAMLAAFVGYLFWSGWSAIRQQLRIDQAIFTQASTLDWGRSALLQWLGHLLSESLILLMPLFAILMIVAIIANLAQVGAVFSAKPLTPDFDRINPTTGMKRLFSLRTLYDSMRGVFKVILIVGVVAIVIRHLLPTLLTLLQVAPVGYAGMVLDQIESLLSKLVIAMLTIAMLDMFYTRWEFGRRMRMSRREVRDEHKQREGDPRIRARLRELRNEMLKRSRAIRKVPGADVLITNPTHLAVALSYKHGAMPAPKLVAKGAGEIAAAMRDVARRHNIPIVQNMTLARELFRQVSDDGFVPEELYPQVARILVWVFALREAHTHAGSAK